jgi:hypothetical protein
VVALGLFNTGLLRLVLIGELYIQYGPLSHFVPSEPSGIESIPTNKIQNFDVVI